MEAKARQESDLGNLFAHGWWFVTGILVLCEKSFFAFGQFWGGTCMFFIWQACTQGLGVWFFFRIPLPDPACMIFFSRASAKNHFSHFVQFGNFPAGHVWFSFRTPIRKIIFRIFYQPGNFWTSHVWFFFTGKMWKMIFRRIWALRKKKHTDAKKNFLRPGSLTSSAPASSVFQKIRFHEHLFAGRIKKKIG